MDIGWKLYDQSIDFFSAHKDENGKVPWGQVKSCEYNRTQNKQEEWGNYIKFWNEKGKSRNFKIDLLYAQQFGFNDFTGKVHAMKVAGQGRLLAEYVNSLLRAEDFYYHREDLHTELGGSKDATKDVFEELEGSQDELATIIKSAKDCAIKVDVKDDVLKSVSERVKKRKNTSDPVVKVKKSKNERMVDDRTTELLDVKGFEKSFIGAYVGRKDVVIDEISLSDKVASPANPFKVQGLVDSIKSQFDPSLFNLTVYPVLHDQSKGEHYKVIHGNHRYLAMLELDKKGILKTLPGLEDRRITCYIINNQDSEVVNYGLIRGNSLAAKFQRPPYIHELLYCLEYFKTLYGKKEKAFETVKRYARTMMLHPDEITALNKINNWSPAAFESLLTVLKKFELYETNDAKELTRITSRLMRGDKLQVSKAMFKNIGKCDPVFFKDNSHKILSKEISLKSLLENAGKIKENEKTVEVISKLIKCQDLVQIERKYPGKFTNKVIEKFNRAEINETSANLQGVLLDQYCQRVVNEESEVIEMSVKSEVCENINEVSQETLKNFDVVILNIGQFDPGVVGKTIETILSADLPKVALILCDNEESQMKTLALLYSKTIPADFSKMQVFFERKKPSVSQNIANNMNFGILFGRFIISNPPLHVYNGDFVCNLRSFIAQVAPNRSKIGYFSQGSKQIVSVHSEDTSVTYFGTDSELKKLFKTIIPSEKQTIAQEKPKISEDDTGECAKKDTNSLKIFNFEEEMKTIEAEIDN